MTRKAAIALYFSRTKQPNFTVEALMAWNPNKTMKENCEALSLSRGIKFAKTYGLKFARVYSGKIAVSKTHRLI